MKSFPIWLICYSKSAGEPKMCCDANPNSTTTTFDNEMDRGERSTAPFPFNGIVKHTMSQNAAADDSACPPLTKAANMTIITRVLLTLLQPMKLFPFGFKRELHLQK